jgi:hypothetical protein
MTGSQKCVSYPRVKTPYKSEYYVRQKLTVQAPVWSLRRVTLRLQAMKERPTRRQCAATLLRSLRSPNDTTP